MLPAQIKKKSLEGLRMWNLNSFNIFKFWAVEGKAEFSLLVGQSWQSLSFPVHNLRFLGQPPVRWSTTRQFTSSLWFLRPANPDQPPCVECADSGVSGLATSCYSGWQSFKCILIDCYFIVYLKQVSDVLPQSSFNSL